MQVLKMKGSGGLPNCLKIVGPQTFMESTGPIFVDEGVRFRVPHALAFDYCKVGVVERNSNEHAVKVQEETIDVHRLFNLAKGALKQ